ncbi:MAG: hypothetical protein HWE22_13835 [Flavobacteriales bacterium]|nr:hypothetical protein [Flavobacteriales bacterium]
MGAICQMLGNGLQQAICPWFASQVPAPERSATALGKGNVVPLADARNTLPADV